MPVLMEGLESAFDRFGGVPEELLFDQMRAVVLSDDRGAGGGLVLNEEFLRFAAHWGFMPRSCRPYRAQTKGKVERPIRYIRESFFYGRSFANDNDLNEQAARWLGGTANVRRHTTTGERPVDRFERDERTVLLPLANHPYRRLGVRHAPERGDYRQPWRSSDDRSASMGGVAMKAPAPTRRDRLRAMLADLKMSCLPTTARLCGTDIILSTTGAAITMLIPPECQRIYARACGCRQRPREELPIRAGVVRPAFVTMMQTALQGNDRPGRLRVVHPVCPCRATSGSLNRDNSPFHLFHRASQRRLGSAARTSF